MNCVEWWCWTDPHAVTQGKALLGLSLQQIEFASITPEIRTNPFVKGVHLDVRSPVPIRVIRNGKVFPVMNCSYGWLAAGDIAQVIEQKLSKNIQVIPTSAEDPRLKGFVVLNIRTRQDCIDYVQSDLEVFDEAPREVRCLFRLVIDSGRVTPSDLVFRLVGAENYSIVSKRGKELLKEAGVTDEYFSQDILQPS